MPQELHVLRCFNCETFQVHIVKKVPKWACKMCGENQSLKKVYGRGSGKECRLFVQELNAKRHHSDAEFSTLPNIEVSCDVTSNNLNVTDVVHDSANKSSESTGGKWSEFSEFFSNDSSVATTKKRNFGATDTPSGQHASKRLKTSMKNDETFKHGEHDLDSHNFWRSDDDNGENSPVIRNEQNKHVDVDTFHGNQGKKLMPSEGTVNIFEESQDELDLFLNANEIE